MADVKRFVEYRYSIQLTYLNITDNKGTDIKTEAVKSVMIDYDVDTDCMPKIYVNMSLDKSLIDHMIKNCNSNLFIMAIYKYDDLTDTKEKVECFREKFTYFLSNGVNANDSIDYSTDNEEENKENTYKRITIGMLCLKHVNRNKKSIEVTVKNNSIYDIARAALSGFSPLILEPFSNNQTFGQFVFPVHDSVNKTLRELNNYRVFYNTPYRFFQDFKYTYLISSSGKGIKKPDEQYNSILVTVYDILNDKANDAGYIDNKTSGTYEIPINYSAVQVFDNTIANKSKTNIKGISSGGSSKASLKNTASYSNAKTVSQRMNNDNVGMISNLAADSNNNNFFIYFDKNGLDMEMFSINKRISVRNIDKYRDQDGDYLLYRKREMFMREDETFNLITMINLRKIG